METLTLNLPTDLYQHLTTIAKYRDESPKIVAEKWLAKLQFFPFTSTNGSIEIDDPGGKALRDAGLLVELAPGLRELAKPSASLEEVIAILDRAGGRPLSEIVLEQRRSKEW